MLPEEVKGKEVPATTTTTAATGLVGMLPEVEEGKEVSVMVTAVTTTASPGGRKR